MPQSCHDNEPHHDGETGPFRAAAHPEPDSSPAEIDPDAIDKVLYREDNAKYLLQLHLSAAGRLLLATIEPRQPGPIIDRVALLMLFKKLNLTGKPRFDQIDELCHRACRQETSTDVIVLEGEPPQRGQDQHLHFLAQPTRDEKQVAIDQSNRADFRHLSLFENVYPGQTIAVIVPPTPGEAGTTVTGEPIAADPGRLLEPPLAVGENIAAVENDQGEHSLQATQAGRIIYDQQRNAVSVSDLYVIDGNVGLATGDIDFVGRVEIKHDVTMDYTIKAKQGIRVFGNVESSILESEGDILIQGGVSGKGKGLISCGGNLSARYLDNATVRCTGNVNVQNEIVNGTVLCDGKITVASGAIVGGHCSALKGIETLELGSSAGTKTPVTVGESFLAKAQIIALQQKLQALDSSIQALNDQLDEVRIHPERLRGMSDQHKRRVHECGENLKSSRAQRCNIQEAITQLSSAAAQAADPIIHIKKSLYQNVRLGFGPYTSEIKDTMLRPMTIIHYSRRGELRFFPLRPHATAADLEREVFRQEQKDNKDRSRSD